MSKILKVVISIAILVLTFIIGYYVPFMLKTKSIVPIAEIDPSKDLKPLPYGSINYIKDGILYTTVTVIPLNCITKVTLNTDIVMSVTIEYRYTKSHSGMLIMSYAEYKRLFGDSYEKK